MKARIKATGEVVEVEFVENILEKDVFYAMCRIVGTDIIYPYNALEIIYIDWEQRTWDAAVAIMVSIMGSKEALSRINALAEKKGLDASLGVIYTSINSAKALVAEYRKGE